MVNETRISMCDKKHMNSCVAFQMIMNVWFGRTLQGLYLLAIKLGKQLKVKTNKKRFIFI